jgi:hypothetical protein
VTEAIRKAWKLGQLLPCPDCSPCSSSGRRITMGNVIPDIDLYNSPVNIPRSEKIQKYFYDDVDHIDLLLVIGK